MEVVSLRQVESWVQSTLAGKKPDLIILLSHTRYRVLEVRIRIQGSVASGGKPEGGRTNNTQRRGNARIAM